jgi:hypothetical protein
MAGATRFAIGRPEVPKKSGSPRFSADPLVLAAFLIAPRRINKDSLNPCFAERQQVVDMPVKFLVSVRVPPEPGGQAIHRAAGVDISPLGKYRGAQLSHTERSWSP